MKPSEAGLILTAAATIDQRTICDEDAIGWSEVLTKYGVTSVRDALTAVTNHYGTTRDRITPFDVIDRVKAIRKARLVAALNDHQGVIPIPAGLAIRTEVKWRRAWLTAVKDDDDPGHPTNAAAIANRKTGVRGRPAAVEVPRPDRVREIEALARSKSI